MSLLQENCWVAAYIYVFQCEIPGLSLLVRSTAVTVEFYSIHFLIEFFYQFNLDELLLRGFNFLPSWIVQVSTKESASAKQNLCDFKLGWAVWLLRIRYSVLLISLFKIANSRDFQPFGKIAKISKTKYWNR